MATDSLNFETKRYCTEQSSNGNVCVGTDINSLILQTINGNTFQIGANNKQTEECISNTQGSKVGVFEDECDCNVFSRTVNTNSVNSIDMDGLGPENGIHSNGVHNETAVNGVVHEHSSNSAEEDINNSPRTRSVAPVLEESVDNTTRRRTPDQPNSVITDLIADKVSSNGEEQGKDNTDDTNPDRREILKLRKDLESVRGELLQELSSVDDERLVMQESILMVQNKIYQQRRVLLKCLDDLTSGKYQQTKKHSEQQEEEINQTFGILEDRKANLENLMGKLPRMAEKSHNYNVPDIIEAGQKILDECKRKLTPLKLSYLEYSEGEVNFEGLSSMIGSIKTAGYSSDDQNAISARFINGVVPGLNSRARVREVSVESTCTQITSGDLSDQFTVATQTDFDGDKGCVGPAEGKMILRVNVEDIENNIDRCCESTPLDLLGLSWRIMANKHWRDQLQIRLYYKNIEHIEKCVEYVEYGYTFKLVNHINDTWSIVKKETHKIGRDSWWDSVVGWGRLEDSKCGYVLNKWFTIEATVSVIDVKFF